MAADKEIASKRDMTLNRIRSKYPDRSFDDDEAVFGQIYDDYDEYDRKLGESDKRISELEGHEKAFSDMFTSDPRSARMMMEWKNGGDPAMALIRIYGDDILEAINDPEKQEELSQARKEYAEKLAENEEYQKQYDENLPASLETIEKYARENGLDDDTIDKAMKTLAGITRDFMLGKIKPETIDLMLKALNHDTDVAAAGEQGEIAGRNAKITESLRKGRQNDGLPKLDGKNSTPASGSAKKNIFDLAAEAR